MDYVVSWLKKDLQPYAYMIKADDEKRYVLIRFICLFLGGMIGAFISIYWISSWYVRFLCFMACILLVYKFPYVLIKLEHNKRCNRMQDAVIIWVKKLALCIK